MARGASFPNQSELRSGILLGAIALGIFVLEKRRPLRRQSQREPRRTVRNLALGALSMSAVAALEQPLVTRLAKRAGEHKRGIVQKLPLPAGAKDLLAAAAMDYTIYLWHIATHRVPILWRFHLVHHLDLDLDSTTALRFHFTEMILSVPYRALQVLGIGTSERALRMWQRFFFLSVLFHHGNLRLPRRLDRLLSFLLVTPRMHGIHHSTVESETHSNWSSGLSIWDRLHGTFRLDVPQEQIRIGVPNYRSPAELRLLPSITLPFRPHRPAWPPREKVSA